MSTKFKNAQQSRFLAYSVIVATITAIVLMIGLLFLRQNTDEVHSAEADMKPKEQDVEGVSTHDKILNEFFTSQDSKTEMNKNLSGDTADAGRSGQGGEGTELSQDYLVYDGFIIDKKNGVVIVDEKTYPLEKMGDAGMDIIDGVAYPIYFGKPTRIVTKGKVTLSAKEIAKQRALIADIIQTFRNLSQKEQREIDSWRNFLDRMEKTGGYETRCVITTTAYRAEPSRQDGTPLESTDKIKHATDSIDEQKMVRGGTPLTNQKFVDTKSGEDVYREVTIGVDKSPYEAEQRRDQLDKSTIAPESHSQYPTAREEEKYRALLSELLTNPPIERKLEIWRELAKIRGEHQNQDDK